MEDAAAALFRRGEAAFAVLALFLFSQALVPLLVEGNGPAAGGGGGAYEGNTVLRMMFASVHALTLGFLLVRWRPAGAALRRAPAAAALVALAIASTAWSAAPDITLRRSFAFLGTTAFGIFLAARFDTREVLRLLAAALGAAAALSAVFAVALPGLGVDQGVHAGAWQGIYTEKNTLGQMMALAAMAFVLLRADAPRGRRWPPAAGALLAAALIALSRSGTALAVLLLFLLLLGVLRALRWRATRAAPLVAGIALAAGAAGLLFVARYEAVLTSLGKDPTLTGRTPMWEALAASVGERPWLGHGYAGFWLGDAGPSARALERIGWQTPGAHNGYLDAALQLGLVGLALLLAAVALAYLRSLAVVRATTDAAGLFPAAFLSILLVYNFTETMLLAANSIFWALLVAVLASPLLRKGAVGPAPAGGRP